MVLAGNELLFSSGSTVAEFCVFGFYIQFYLCLIGLNIKASVLCPYAAFTFDLWKNRHVLDGSAMGEIAIGFVMAFIAAVIVVRWVLGYISRHGFALFGWWRIVVGLAAWAALLMGF